MPTRLNPTTVTATVQRCGCRQQPFLNRDDLWTAALSAADTVTEITHNHPEGMKGARGDNPRDLACVSR